MLVITVCKSVSFPMMKTDKHNQAIFILKTSLTFLSACILQHAAVFLSVYNSPIAWIRRLNQSQTSNQI